MDLLATLFPFIAAVVILVGPWVILAAAALRFGVDSRPGVGDDHRWGAPTGSL